MLLTRHRLSLARGPSMRRKTMDKGQRGDAPSGGAGSYLVHLPVGAIPDQLYKLEDAGGILGGEENKC